MAADFDPYFKWLGIPPEEQPPNHYRLLGIPLFASDPDVIQNAVDQRMAHLRTMQIGPRAVLAEKLLNELSAATVGLLDPAKKAAYDSQLPTIIPPSHGIAPFATVPPFSTPLAAAPLPSGNAPIAPPLVEDYRPAVVNPSRSRYASRRPRPTHRTLLQVALGGIAGIIVGGAILRFGFQIDPFHADKEPQPAVTTNPKAKPPNSAAENANPRAKSAAFPSQPAAPEAPPHYLSTDTREKIRFLDWRNQTWENDIAEQFDVKQVGDGYRVRLNTDGYEHKLILFPTEDVTSRNLCIAFTVEYGNIRLSLRPKDLAPKGIPVFDGWYDPEQRLIVRLWIENGVAKATLNGEPISLLQLPDCFGYFAIDVSRRSSMVIHELYFTDLRPPPRDSPREAAGADAVRFADAVTFVGHKYLVVFRRGIKWTEACELCTKMGGHLAVANSKEEFEFLMTLNGLNNLWIGATKSDGEWKWIDGTPVDPSLWFNGAPKDTPEELYVYLNGVRSIWNHTDEAETIPGFICEWSK